MSHFLITGGAGFLGAALANHLSREGHAVRVLDDLSTGSPDALAPEVLFTRGDISDRPKLWTMLQGVDCVYHLAARVLVAESILYPREYNNVNVGGTVALMEAMRDVGIKRVVLISSGAVYGSQDEQPVKESFTPRPKSPYAVSKLSAEYYVHTIGKLWGIETTALRVFNAYGPGQHIPPVHTPVIPNFLRHTMMQGTLVVNGEGTQTRDYVYVDDVVHAMRAAANASDIDQMTINVGSGVETSVKELARLIPELLQREPEVITNPRSGAGPDRLCADISLAREKLHFEPLTSLRDGLLKTVRFDPKLRQIAEQNGITF